MQGLNGGRLVVQCLAMNPDKLIGDQLCASSSNRNFKGRQSPTGRTMLMAHYGCSCCYYGVITDSRELSKKINFYYVTRKIIMLGL